MTKFLDVQKNMFCIYKHSNDYFWSHKLLFLSVWLDCEVFLKGGNLNLLHAFAPRFASCLYFLPSFFHCLSFVSILVSIPLSPGRRHLFVLYSSRLDLYTLPRFLSPDLPRSSHRSRFLCFHPVLLHPSTPLLGAARFSPGSLDCESISFCPASRVFDGASRSLSLSRWVVLASLISNEALICQTRQ